MIERIKKMVGRKVFIEISDRRFYNGVINEVGDDHLSMTDKFGDDLIILISEIKLLQPKDRQTDDILQKIQT